MRQLLICLSLLTLPLTASAPPPATPQEITELKAMSRGFSHVAKKATPAVVFIRVEGKGSVMGPGFDGDGMDSFHQEFFRRFFGMPSTPQQQAPRIGQGSGFIVSSDGYILTNNHIVNGADSIKVGLTDGRRFDAKVVGTDPQTDIAVIKIEAEELSFLKLADSDAAEVGEWVIAIGSPFGLEATVTVGVVSAKGRDELHITDFEDFIQTDAAINPGNSGGPLLNLDGEVIGVNTAIVTGSGGYMGIGFAIPSNMAKRVMDQLIHAGSVTRGFLGVTLQPVDEELAAAFGLPRPIGGLVTEVAPSSPAKEGGIEQGDIILEFNGQKVESISALRNAVSMVDPGSKVQLRINREGKEKKLSVTIGAHPETKTQPGTPAHSLGLEVESLSDHMASQLGYTNERGVIVKRVDPGSPAARAGIKPGITLIVRVNRTPVETPDDFYKALDDASKSSDRVLLLVRHGQVMRFVSLKSGK
ncbi:MAG: DegQ family serine endoprotease [Verrucomicrobia bacterium]|nr:DegQ family serine endoprotease [Verrucomicrobiota bacterium]